MSLARAASALAIFRGPNTEAMDIFEVEFSLEIDETMEMISAISVALSAYVVLSTKSFDTFHKVWIWPVVTRLGKREKEITSRKSWPFGPESF